jgi:DNA-directed RNA polymerase sigma subunit (sigma70/sigma32)
MSRDQTVAPPGEGIGAETEVSGARLAEAEGLRMYREQVRRLRTLGPGEEEELLSRAREGDRGAAGELAWAYLRHVVEIVDARRPGRGEVLDLLEVGNSALVQAIATFRADHHADFGSYARSTIHEALEQVA